ncbi:NET domain-containing protein [Entamoeba marina]
MSNSSKSESDPFGLEDLLYLENPTQDVIFNLKEDYLTKVKQTIIAIPHISVVLQGHYQEVMNPQDFQTMCLQLNLIKRRIIGNTQLDINTKRKLFLTFVFHVNQFLDCYQLSCKIEPIHPQYNIPVQTEFPLISTSPPHYNVMMGNNCQMIDQNQYNSYPVAPVMYPVNTYPQMKQEPLLQYQPEHYVQSNYPPNQQTIGVIEQQKIILSKKLSEATPRILGNIAQYLDPESKDIEIDFDVITENDIINIFQIFDRG